jgi:hypothetical protein
VSTRRNSTAAHRIPEADSQPRGGGISGAVGARARSLECARSRSSTRCIEADARARHLERHGSILTAVRYLSRRRASSLLPESTPSFSSTSRDLLRESTGASTSSLTSESSCHGETHSSVHKPTEAHDPLRSRGWLATGELLLPLMSPRLLGAHVREVLIRSAPAICGIILVAILAVAIPFHAVQSCHTPLLLSDPSGYGGAPSMPSARVRPSNGYSVLVPSDIHLSSLCPFGDLGMRVRRFAAEHVHQTRQVLILGDVLSTAGGEDGAFNLTNIIWRLHAARLRKVTGCSWSEMRMRERQRCVVLPVR